MTTLANCLATAAKFSEPDIAELERTADVFRTNGVADDNSAYLAATEQLVKNYATQHAQASHKYERTKAAGDEALAKKAESAALGGDRVKTGYGEKTAMLTRDEIRAKLRDASDALKLRVFLAMGWDVREGLDGEVRQIASPRTNKEVAEFEGALRNKKPVGESAIGVALSAFGLTKAVRDAAVEAHNAAAAAAEESTGVSESEVDGETSEETVEESDDEAGDVEEKGKGAGFGNADTEVTEDGDTLALDGGAAIQGLKGYGSLAAAAGEHTILGASETSDQRTARLIGGGLERLAKLSLEPGSVFGDGKFVRAVEGRATLLDALGDASIPLEQRVQLLRKMSKSKDKADAKATITHDAFVATIQAREADAGKTEANQKADAALKAKKAEADQIEKDIEAKRVMLAKMAAEQAEAKEKAARTRKLAEAAEGEAEAKQSLTEYDPADVEGAREDWDENPVEGDPTFDQLTARQKVAWVRASLTFYTGGTEGKQRAYNQAQEAIINEYKRNTATDAGPANDLAGERIGRLEASEPTSVDAGKGTVLPNSAETQVPGAGPAIQKSTAEPTRGSTASAVETDIKAFLRSGAFGRTVVVVQSMEQLPLMARASLVGERPQGFVLKGRAYLIADNIAPGNARAVLMHEVGSHLGLQRLLTEAQFDNLVDQINEWAGRADGSLESKLAVAALKRASDAGTQADQLNNELVAYFIEEAVRAGVNPKALDAKTPLGNWFRTLWAAFKVALHKLGVNPDKLTSQDIVDMAYGAARLELAGAWHGTSHDFRKFNHAHMGSGEGAQVFGWGSYFAQSAKLGYEYWKTGVANKASYPEAKRVSFGGVDVSGLIDGSMSPIAAVAELEAAGVLDEAAANVAEIALGYLRVSNFNVRETLKDMPTWRIFKRSPDRLPAAQAFLQNLDIEITPYKVPDGNLMRLDFNVADDEWLDLDKKLTDQSPLVLKALEKIRSALDSKGEGEWASDTSYLDDMLESLNADWGDLNGHDLLGTRLSQYQHNLLEHAISEGVLPDAPDHGNLPRAISEYLDSIGIKGSRFLDKESRDRNSGPEVQQLQSALENAKEEAAYRDKMLAQHDSPVSNARLTAARDVAHAELEKAQRALSELLSRAATSNFVVFNDKNIQRVAGLRNADPDRAQFSKPPTAAPVSADTTYPQVGKDIMTVLRSAGQKALNALTFTEDVVSRAVDAGILSAQTYLALDKQRSAVVASLERKAAAILEGYANLPYEAQRIANTLLYDSTREGKWAFKPAWNNSAVLDPVMAARFKGLQVSHPAAANFVHAVFKHGYDTLQLKKKAATEHVDAAYAKLIADVNHDPASVEKLKTEKKKLLDKFASLFSIGANSPYAPLRRDGDYVVVGNSQQYAGGSAEEQAKLVNDPAHHHVSQVDTELQALALVRELKASGMTAYHRPKEGSITELYGATNLMSAFLKIKNQVESLRGSDSHSKDVLDKMNGAVTKLYLESLAEGSARKAEMRRKGVSGKVDMVRAFALQGVADSRFMAAVAFNTPTLEALTKMRMEATHGENQANKTRLYNELAKRHTQSLDYQPTPVADALARASSVWTLATSPAYYLANLTQTSMISLPYMTKRHDYFAAGGAIWRAYGDVWNLVKHAKLFEQLDFSKVPQADRAAITDLVNQGRIDIGLNSEMGNFNLPGGNRVQNTLKKWDNNLRIMSQKVESINRLSAALAAYRLELVKNGGNHAGAVDYASSVISQTHGDYSRQNAPRVFNTSLGKVALQFRKFQLIQLTLLAKLAREATSSLSGPEAKAARKALAFTFAHMGVMGGAVALPGYALLSAIASALGGDGPDEPELELRAAIGDKHTADLLLHGLPGLLGANISNKIGMGTVTSVAPFANLTPTTRKEFLETAGTLLSGPLGGLGARAAQGVHEIYSGDYYKGLENLMPSLGTSMLRAGRFAVEGVTNGRGDKLMNAEEINLVDTFMQALGVQPMTQAHRQLLQNAKFNLDAYFADQAKSIEHDYISAVGSGGPTQEARDAWVELQNLRGQKGYARQPLSTLLKAPQEAAKRARMVTGGVQYNKSSKGFVEAQAAY